MSAPMRSSSLSSPARRSWRLVAPTSWIASLPWVPSPWTRALQSRRASSALRTPLSTRWGGAALANAFAWLRDGGVLVSSAAEPDQELAERHKVRTLSMLVAVTSHKLVQLADLFSRGDLQTRVGEVLALSDARRAHRHDRNGHRPAGKLILVP